MKDFPTKSSAREEVWRRSLADQLNANRICGKARFREITEHCIANELRSPMVVNPLSHNTINCYFGNIRRYQLDRLGNCFAKEIEPSEVEEWSYDLSRDAKGEERLAWDTISKLQNIVVQIYAHAQRNKLINPDAKYSHVRGRLILAGRATVQMWF